MLVAATPTPPPTDRSNDVDMAATQPTNDAYTRAYLRALGSEMSTTSPFRCPRRGTVVQISRHHTGWRGRTFHLGQLVEVEWRWPGRHTSAPACLLSSRPLWTMRRSWRQKACNALWTTCVVAFWPGIKASGLNQWLLEALAAFCLALDGPWIVMGDWNMEPAELAQAGWLDVVGGKVFSTTTVTCAGGAGSLIDYFVVSVTMAHLVQQVHQQPHIGQSDSLSKPLRGVTGFWHDDGLCRSPRRCQWNRGTGRGALEQAWLDWLRAAEEDWCRIHNLCGAQRRPFLGRSKGLIIEHVSFAQAIRKDTRKTSRRRRRHGHCDEWWRRLRANWQLGGGGERTCTRLNVQLTWSPHSRCPILDSGSKVGNFPLRPGTTRSMTTSAKLTAWGTTNIKQRPSIAGGLNIDEIHRAVMCSGTRATRLMTPWVLAYPIAVFRQSDSSGDGVGSPHLDGESPAARAGIRA